MNELHDNSVEFAWVKSLSDGFYIHVQFKTEGQIIRSVFAPFRLDIERCIIDWMRYGKFTIQSAD